MNTEEIEHLALLARIELTDAEKASLATSIGDILGFVGALSDITSVEKKKQVGNHFNVMRDDVPTNTPGAYTEALLSAAPKRHGQYIEVKKILGGESN